jgi:hypothetical protein
MKCIGYVLGYFTGDLENPGGFQPMLANRIMHLAAVCPVGNRQQRGPERKY